MLKRTANRSISATWSWTTRTDDVDGVTALCEEVVAREAKSMRAFSMSTACGPGRSRRKCFGDGLTAAMAVAALGACGRTARPAPPVHGQYQHGPLQIGVWKGYVYEGGLNGCPVPAGRSETLLQPLQAALRAGRRGMPRIAYTLSTCGPSTPPPRGMVVLPSSAFLSRQLDTWRPHLSVLQAKLAPSPVDPAGTMLPLLRDPLVLYYRPDVLRAAGIASSPATWTLADFLRAARQVAGAPSLRQRYPIASGGRAIWPASGALRTAVDVLSGIVGRAADHGGVVFGPDPMAWWILGGYGCGDAHEGITAAVSSVRLHAACTAWAGVLRQMVPITSAPSCATVAPFAGGAATFQFGFLSDAGLFAHALGSKTPWRVTALPTIGTHRVQPIDTWVAGLTRGNDWSRPMVAGLAEVLWGRSAQTVLSAESGWLPVSPTLGTSIVGARDAYVDDPGAVAATRWDVPAERLGNQPLAAPLSGRGGYATTWNVAQVMRAVLQGVPVAQALSWVTASPDANILCEGPTCRTAHKQGVVGGGMVMWCDRRGLCSFSKATYTGHAPTPGAGNAMLRVR